MDMKLWQKDTFANKKVLLELGYFETKNDMYLKSAASLFVKKEKDLHLDFQMKPFYVVKILLSQYNSSTFNT